MSILYQLLPYLKVHRWALAVGFFFMTLQNLGFCMTPIYMKELLDELLGENRGSVVAWKCLEILFFTCISGFSMYMMRQKIIMVSRKIEYQLRKDLFSRLIYQDFSFFRKHQTGDLISRCTNDLDHVRVLLGPGIMYIPNSLSRLVFFAPLMVGLNTELSFYLLIQMLILIAAIVIIMPRLKPLHKKLQEHVGHINDRVWQVLSGISTIKLYTREKLEHQRFGDLNQNYIKKHMSVEKYNSVLWPLFMTIFGLSEVILLGIGGAAVIDGKLTLGELLQFKVMVGVLAFPVLSLGWVMAIMQQGMSAMERIDVILKSTKPKPQEGQTWHSIRQSDGSLPKELSIEIKNLTYDYENQKGALKDLSLSIQPGQTLAITGAVGSGKSTLLHLINGILRPQKGEIFINDVDLLDINPEDIFAAMSFVPQNSFLFSKNVEDNIALSQLPIEGFLDELTATKVKNAAQQAAFDKDVMIMQEQYRTIVGERGITLSGGQRQRMSIARALFKERPLLILDDSLSAVDSETEHEVLTHMKTWSEKQSLIIVSHRISALKQADHILVLKDGAIIEAGTHASLISNRGHYANLSKLQQMEQELENLEPNV